MNKKKIFIFDFDGTLIRSNEIKYKALLETLENHEIIKEQLDVKKYCEDFIRASGISREKKIRNRFKDILSEKNIEDIINNYSSKVDQFSKNLQLSKEINEALKIFNKNGEVFILSGGRVDEITRICNKSNTLKYVNGVICSSSGKVNFLKILKNLGKVIFFGDSEIDYRASITSNTDFIRITGFSDLEIDDFKGKSLNSINDYKFS